MNGNTPTIRNLPNRAARYSENITEKYFRLVANTKISQITNRIYKRWWFLF